MRRILLASLLSATVAGLSACSDAQEPVAVDHDRHDATEHAAQTAPATTASLPRQAAPEEARVFFVNLKDGDTVSSPVTIRFGLEGMKLVPAGTSEPFSGHHHLLVDVDTLPNMGHPLPATDQIIHFGAAQTETTLELSPGPHTLQLLLGDALHIPHQPPVMSERITITVE